MYHRVLPVNDPRYRLEEPGMVVTPETLRDHVFWIREQFELVSLGDWLKAARSGDFLPKRAVAITFDDGWRDNFEYALPVLKEANAPATLFVVTDFIGTNRLFWPNRLMRVLRQAQLKSSESDDARWVREKLAPGGLGSENWLARAIGAAKAYEDDEILDRLKRLEAEFGLADHRDRELLTWSELREMHDSRLFEIGSHTKSHLRLSRAVSDERLRAEIIESKRRLEAELGTPVQLFCYPNGNVTAKAVSLVRAHYSGAVTTRPGVNTPSIDATLLRRVSIHQDIAEYKQGFLARINGF